MENIGFILLIFILSYCNSGNSASNKSNLQKPSSSGFDKGNYINEISSERKPAKVGQIPVPKGYLRLKTDSLSFGDYLRNMELDTIDNRIYSYNGAIISDSGYQYAIIKMDIGNKNLQQCADAVMRIRAEYLFCQKQYEKIHFNFLSDGRPRFYTDYAKGDYSYKTFRKYMDYIFTWANTTSLQKEMLRIPEMKEIQIGDVFIQQGKSFGHAVLVMDIAIHEKTGKKIFMVAQSYMPAQSIHVLKNLNDPDISPWYDADFEEQLFLPSWTFDKNNLYRFR